MCAPFTSYLRQLLDVGHNLVGISEGVPGLSSQGKKHTSTYAVSTGINANRAFSKSKESAKAVVAAFIDSLVPSGYIRFESEGA